VTWSWPGSLTIILHLRQQREKVSYSTEEEEEEEDAFRSVSVAAATSLTITFLEIAMISLISEKAPRTDAIAMKKKMHSDPCLLLQQHL
jgi:tRNA A37 threonylcarbamoyladenosine synthetase subunit TsaC/SUA5/YrdC